ncbi:protein of unknown function [Lactiplantibacillus plantarum]
MKKDCGTISIINNNLILEAHDDNLLRGTTWTNSGQRPKFKTRHD